MMPVRSRPAMQRALSVVTARIEHCRRVGADTLPPLRTLAREARVSAGSMLRALHVLRDHGLLQIQRGSGARLALRPRSHDRTVACVEPPPILVTEACPRWRQVKHCISEQLLGCDYESGELLPDAKQLCARFGTSPRSLRLALQSLSHEGRLEPYRRSYRVAGGGARTSRARLGIIATMDLHEFLDKLGPRSVSLWRALEDECRRCGLSVEIYDYRKSIGSFPWPDGRSQRLIERIDVSKLLGCIVWPYALDAMALGQILDMLAPARLPVSVLCETWESTPKEYAAVVGRLKRAQLFTVAQSGASGSAVGAYLLRLGHRRVAVFAPEAAPCDGWLRRWRGICDVFTEAGVTEQPLLYACPDGYDRSAADIRRQLDRFEQAGEQLLAGYTTGLTQSFVANQLKPCLSASRLALRMRPVFQAALEQTACTAWVGLSDVCARTAMHFLRASGVRVPEHISVVGIDNDNEAFADGLTTYDFNMPAVVHAMISHIRNSRRGPGDAPGPHCVELPGRMRIRQSAGFCRLLRKDSFPAVGR